MMINFDIKKKFNGYIILFLKNNFNFIIENCGEFNK